MPATLIGFPKCHVVGSRVEFVPIPLSILEVDDRVSLAVAISPWLGYARIWTAAIEIRQSAVSAATTHYFANDREKRTIYFLAGAALLALMAPG